MSSKWSPIRQILSSNTGAFVLILICGILSNVLTILILVSIGKYYSLVFAIKSHRALILDLFPHSWVNVLPNFLWFFVGLAASWMVFSFIQKYTTAIIGERMIKSIRERLFSHQLRAKMHVYDDRGFGKYLLRYSGDMHSILNFLTIGMIQFTIDFLMLIFAVLAMFFLDSYMTLVVLCGVIVTVTIIFFLNKTLHNSALNLRNRKSGLLSFVSNTLPLLLTIKGFNREAVEEKKFNERSSKIYSKGIHFQRVKISISTVVQGMLYLTLGGILILIYTLNLSKLQTNGGHLLSFILLFMTILPVFRRVLRVSSIWKVGNISIDKLASVMDLKLDANGENQNNLHLETGTIRFKNVCFSYSNKELLIDNLNLKLKGSSTTVLTSTEKLPKTSLIKLILGIYSPQKGIISVDRQDLSGLNLKSLKRKIAVLSVDFPLMGETVFEACSYSNAVSKKPEVQILLDELQNHLPEESKITLDFKIGDRGCKLTEFQNQVVVSMRCILTDKPILIVENLSKFADNPAFNHILGKLKSFENNQKTIVFMDKTYCSFYDEFNAFHQEL